MDRRRTLRYLERLFQAEIDRVPAYLPPVAREALIKAGYVQMVTRHGSDRLGRYEYDVPALTPAGHYFYCMSCNGPAP